MSIKHKILLVEDEVKLGNVIRDELNSHDYDTDLAADGLEASKLFSQNAYALVLLDINLPYKNGYVLCREFRDQNQKIPIIMLTAAGEIHAKSDDPFALLVRDGGITTDQEAIARPGWPHPRQPIHGVVQDEAVLQQALWVWQGRQRHGQYAGGPASALAQ